MPFYDYKCPICGKKKLDVMHSIGECDHPSEATLKLITCQDHGIMRRTPCQVAVNGITGKSEGQLLADKQAGIKERFKRITAEQAESGDSAIVPSERARIKAKYAKKGYYKKKK